MLTVAGEVLELGHNKVNPAQSQPEILSLFGLISFPTQCPASRQVKQIYRTKTNCHYFFLTLVFF